MKEIHGEQKLKPKTQAKRGNGEELSESQQKRFILVVVVSIIFFFILLL